MSYLKFLTLVQSIRALPSFPTMDSVEEQLLNAFAAAWHTKKPITVVDAMNIVPEISTATAHRRLKTLRQKGLIALNTDESDNRVKFIVSTPLTKRYFAKLDECLAKAQSN